MNMIINILILGYFLVLMAERIQSLARAGSDMFKDGFERYVSIVTIISLAASLIMLVFMNGQFFKGLFTGAETLSYTMISITAGVALLSGMVHTHKTIAPLQFVAYGMLIVAMILRCVQASSANPGNMWFWLIYTIVFSMAIPVVYRFKNDEKDGTLFVVIEVITSVILVALFTMMLIAIMNAAMIPSWLLLLSFIVTIIGDGCIVYLQWKNEHNYFVMIFAILTAVMFVLGKILELFNII